jgi:2'-5' RNA ligase
MGHTRPVRLFVAAWPDAKTRDGLSALPLGSVPGVRPTGAGAWHATLRFLGTVDEEAVPVLVDALSRAVGTVPGPTCRVGPETAWTGNGRVLYLPVVGLDALAAAVVRATTPVAPGGPGRDRPFSGHITVARTGRRSPRPAVRAQLAGIPFRSEFEVDTVDLVASTTSSQGARYTTLERMRLAPGRTGRPPVA